jgi:hypothetical protein
MPKKKKVLVCTVNRKTWARGNKNMPAEEDEFGEKNHLLNEIGSRCCLGFLGQNCSVSDEVMLNTTMPGYLPPEEYSKYPTLDAPYSNWEDFAAINDNPNLTEAERE